MSDFPRASPEVHDDYVNAERRGVAGFGHRFTQKG